MLKDGGDATPVGVEMSISRSDLAAAESASANEGQKGPSFGEGQPSPRRCGTAESRRAPGSAVARLCAMARKRDAAEFIQRRVSASRRDPQGPRFRNK